MDDLLCCETTCECRAIADPVLLDDDRVLRNLLRLEERYPINSRLFECVQLRELNPDMRRVIADWMLEVCEDQNCQEDVFPLAMSYLDRFLSICKISRSMLQLLASTCLLIASKIRETRPLTAQKLVYYSANSFKCEDLWMWELMVLTKLKWEVSTVTAHDFLLPLMRRIPITENTVDSQMVLRHTGTFIALCSREFQFSNFTPSIVASASLAAALQGLKWPTKTGCSLQQLIRRLCQLTGVEGEYLSNCLTRIESLVRTVVCGSPSGNYPGGEEPSAPPPGQLATVDKLANDDHSVATTPTDVHDVHFQ